MPYLASMSYFAGPPAAASCRVGSKAFLGNMSERSPARREAEFPQHVTLGSTRRFVPGYSRHKVGTCIYPIAVIANLYQHLNPDMELLPGRRIPCGWYAFEVGCHIPKPNSKNSYDSPKTAAPTNFLEVLRLFSTIPYAAGGLADLRAWLVNLELCRA